MGKKTLVKLENDNDFVDLEKKYAKTNYFEILNERSRETQHSKVIAWLLNPRGSHGLGDFALKNLINLYYKKRILRKKIKLKIGMIW